LNGKVELNSNSLGENIMQNPEQLAIYLPLQITKMAVNAFNAMTWADTYVAEMKPGKSTVRLTTVAIEISNHWEEDADIEIRLRFQGGIKENMIIVEVMDIREGGNSISDYVHEYHRIGRALATSEELEHAMFNPIKLVGEIVRACTYAVTSE
jgi:hypothetical protein